MRKRAAEIASRLRGQTVADEEIIRQIREEPELVQAECLSGANLFLEAVVGGRFSVAQALREMGANIHWTCKASKKGQDRPQRSVLPLIVAPALPIC